MRHGFVVCRWKLVRAANLVQKISSKCSCITDTLHFFLDFFLDLASLFPIFRSFSLVLGGYDVFK